MYHEIIKAIILGIIEGLTEFIPVSSTGHLILFGKYISFETANSATFNIAIQLGAIMAVLVLYKKFFKETFLNPRQWISRNMFNIVIATVPILILGFLLYPFIKTYLFDINKVVFALILGAVIMILVERFGNLKRSTTSVDTITSFQAFVIGIGQCAALWPGMSRSGACMVAGILMGLNYRTAARFSFIIAVPVMTAAVAYDLFKSFYLLSIFDIGLIIVGFCVSFLVAMLSIVTFLKWLEKLKLFPFAIYRIVLALVLLLVL